MTTDPVCGMQVDEKNSQYNSRYQDQTYYFCSSECKEQFDEDPEEYIEPESERRTA